MIYFPHFFLSLARLLPCVAFSNSSLSEEVIQSLAKKNISVKKDSFIFSVPLNGEPERSKLRLVIGSKGKASALVLLVKENETYKVSDIIELPKAKLRVSLTCDDDQLYPQYTYVAAQANKTVPPLKLEKLWDIDLVSAKFKSIPVEGKKCDELHPDD